MNRVCHYRDGVLWLDDFRARDLAQQFQTPLYVYSEQTIIDRWLRFADAWPAPHRICYAVKANSHIAILQLMARLGAGFDIVSQGELERVLAAGAEPATVVFSGVAKSAEEIRRALSVGIGCFNVESQQELQRIEAIASDMGKVANVSIRINPNVDAGTHPYISTGLKTNKFGIDYELADAVFDYAAQSSTLNLQGIDCHIGSQITEPAPFLDAAKRMFAWVDKLAKRGIAISHLDLGGGFGVPYHDEAAFPTAEYLQGLLGLAKDYPQLTLMLEPGRSLVAEAGVLLTRVEYVKHSTEKRFAIVDAGMNDLLRPALYQAYHAILPEREEQQLGQVMDIVGPVCETGDFLAHARHLAVAPGDLIAVANAGAYGMSMSSNYNSRRRPAEVLLQGQQAKLITAREQYSQLWQREQLVYTMQSDEGEA